MATGTGTGSPQQAAVLGMTVDINESFVLDTRSPQNKYVFELLTYGPGTSAAFKVSSGGVDASAVATAAATVTQSCAITSTSDLVASYTGASDVSGSFAVNYACGNGTAAPAVSMTLAGGQNPTGEVRRAKKDAGYLAYHLYWDAGYASEINVSSNSYILPASPSYGTRTIYGKIKKADPLHAPADNGAYTDVVAVIINF